MRKPAISKNLMTRLSNIVRLSALIFLLFGVSLQAGAAVPLNPASEIKNQEFRKRDLRNSLETRTDVSLPRETQPASATILDNESPCFDINKIRLVGDMAERFQFALNTITKGKEPSTGRCLGVQGVNVSLTRVQNAIIAKGYVTTRVLVSPQDLTTGELVLTVIPGRIHTIRFADDANPRGRHWNALPASSGELLNLRDIEQALENFKRVPTAEADIQIELANDPDAQPGDSDIVIQYQQATPFRITLSADDGGSKATGKNQGSVTFSGDNLLTLNDLFYYSVNHDLGSRGNDGRGTSGYTLHYSLPFGYWLLSATSSKNDYYQSVAGANQTFIYSGESHNAELKLSRLLYRDGVRKTSASLMAYLKKSRNFIDDTEIEVQRRRMAGWQANLTHREFLAAGTLNFDLGYRYGTGLFNAIKATEDAFGEGTARPKIITAKLGFTAAFKLNKQQFRYSGTWRAQWNKTALIAEDRFFIGGRYTVRGFHGDLTLAGDRGWLFRNDLGVMLGNSGQELYVGLDYGHVSGPTVKFLLGNHLAGGVVGLRGGYKGFSWDLFIGGPISKPDNFKPGTGVSGFNVSWTY